MVLLTILRILLIVTVISFPVILSLKKPSDKLLHLPYCLGLAFEVVMLFYHPLIGIIVLAMAVLLFKYFIVTVDSEEPPFRYEKPILYMVLFIFSSGVIYEVVETIFGRLF